MKAQNILSFFFFSFYLKENNYLKVMSKDFETSTAILRYSDMPLIADIKEYIEKKLKDVTLVHIVGEGDIFSIDLSFDIEEPEVAAHYTRESAKERAYDIKSELEKALTEKHNIPSFSLSGVNVINNNSCKFTISFIYPNKGNFRMQAESLLGSKKKESMKRLSRIEDLITESLTKEGVTENREDKAKLAQLKEVLKKLEKVKGEMAKLDLDKKMYSQLALNLFKEVEETSIMIGKLLFQVVENPGQSSFKWDVFEQLMTEAKLFTAENMDLVMSIKAKSTVKGKGFEYIKATEPKVKKESEEAEEADPNFDKFMKFKADVIEKRAGRIEDLVGELGL
jgi:hypothetical protein